MGRVADTLAPNAEHVIFGHTHRAGPFPGDDLAEWTTLSGSQPVELRDLVPRVGVRRRTAT